MLTPKQQLLLEQIQKKLPNFFSQFDIEIPESPEFKKSVEVSKRVEAIIDTISKQEISPRIVSREMTYHESIIEMWSRKAEVKRDPKGNIICPF